MKEPAPYGAGFSYVNPYVKCCVISGFNAIISRFIPVKIVGAKNLETRMNKRKSRNRKGYGISCRWQREKDSNPHIRSQSPLCYLYTIPLCSDEQKLLYRF